MQLHVWKTYSSFAIWVTCEAFLWIQILLFQVISDLKKKKNHNNEENPNQKKKHPNHRNQILGLDCFKCFSRILTKLLEVSDDPQVLAVAAHDVGEYVRHYPRGKR